MADKVVDAYFSNESGLTISKSFLDIADWKAGEKISVNYSEKDDVIILRNEVSVFDLQESGAIPLSNDLLEELTLPQGTEFSAVYDEATDAIQLTPLTPDAG